MSQVRAGAVAGAATAGAAAAGAANAGGAASAAGDASVAVGAAGAAATPLSPPKGEVLGWCVYLLLVIFVLLFVFGGLGRVSFTLAPMAAAAALLFVPGAALLFIPGGAFDVSRPASGNQRNKQHLEN